MTTDPGRTANLHTDAPRHADRRPLRPFGTAIRIFIVLGLLLGLAACGDVAEDTAADTPTDTPVAPPPPTLDPEPPDPGGQDAAGAAQTELLALARRDADDPRALGPVDAPVVLLQFADLLCGVCAAFAAGDEATLIDTYVEPGLLRLEWWDLPFQGDDALLAARAARAAGEQGAFWAYRDAVYAERLRRGDGRTTEALLAAIAADLDLDVEVFRADLADPQLPEAIAAEAAVGAELGFDRTPSLVIGGYAMNGLETLEVLTGVIDVALLDAGVAPPQR